MLALVGDGIIKELEEGLSDFVMDEVFTEPPPEIQFVGPVQECTRIPIERLRKMQTVSPLNNVDFGSVNPKPMSRNDRMWYTIPTRDPSTGEEVYQEDPSKISICAQCSREKLSGVKYDNREEFATHCPNCASNFCRKFYFDQYNPEKANMVLRWAATIIINEKEKSPFWGSMKPAENIRNWMFETIKVFRSHASGIGKYISHLGTSQMTMKNAANIMFHGRGKQISVDRHQVIEQDGSTTDYYQFSFDHGNRLYSDYMRFLFNINGNEDPKEEMLGDCVELCLGILRIALMYEDCGVDLFGWGNAREVLTGIEHSLLVFNASAYPSGLKNRKMGSRPNSKPYTYEECADADVTMVPKRKFPIVKNDAVQKDDDVVMADVTDAAGNAEGTEYGTAAPSTDADPSGPFVAPGDEDTKRRRITPQAELRGEYENAIASIERLLLNERVCTNCLSSDHKTDAKSDANEWCNKLSEARQSIAVRKSVLEMEDKEEVEISSEDEQMEDVQEEVQQEEETPEEKEPPQPPKFETISFYEKHKTLNEIVGEEEINCIEAGGNDPRKMGFRNQFDFFDALHEHVISTNYIPQIGHESSVDQSGMRRYVNWTKEMSYGKAVPLRHSMANFADPKWGNCRFDNGALRRNYGHVWMQKYTQRWNKVLRHDVGRGGRNTACDELGWVSIEEFLRNDHAWPKGDNSVYLASGQINEEVLHFRRRTLMEGYWYTLNNHPIKRRLLIAAVLTTPEDMEDIHKVEDRDLYDADRLAHSGGWIRPVAIRATQGHSFLGYHKYPLCVNTDHDKMHMKLTRDMSFRLGGGYHVTRVENLASLVTKGIIPGGGQGGRDHVFLGEYAPWDDLNMSTLTYLGPDTTWLLVLYIPARRLLKYKSFITYNGDIIVMETIPFHEVQDVWISGISPGLGRPAVNPRKITSSRIANEIVCQCELANCSALKVIVESVMDGMIRTAQQKDRNDLIDELRGHWDVYSSNPADGRSAASMGAALVLVRYELNSKACSMNRLCPNCMFRAPKNMLSCPQCRGQFVSAGTINLSEPIEIIYSKTEMDELVREQEEKLKDMDFPKDDVELESQETVVVEEQPKKEFSPDQESKEHCEPHQNKVDKDGNLIVEEENEATVLGIMRERVKRDLDRDSIHPAMNFDHIAKIGRFFLFKIADFVVNAYGPWKKFAFLQSDKQKKESMNAGYRHDTTVKGYPFIMTGPNNDEYVLDRGLPVTLDDETVKQHFDALHKDELSKSDGDEMTRRYRFSVVISKLIEALYRRGYEIDGDFATRVKDVNRSAERSDRERVVTNSRIMISYGKVETAMEEAIKIAFGVRSYSFVSRNCPPDHYAFNMDDFQSYLHSKSRGGNVRQEMMHVLHCCSLITVPGMIEMAKDMAQTHVENPVKLKFLTGTPLAEREGINALMPIELQEIEEANDENMEEEQAENMEVSEDVKVEEVDEFTTPNQPPPPLDPLMEDITKEELEKEKRARTTGRRVVEEMTRAENVERVVTDPPEIRTPVVLKPAKPKEPKYIPPTAKTAAKTMPDSSSRKKGEKNPAEPTEKTTVKEEASSASDSKTKMTFQVKEVPKPKTEDVKSEPSSAPAASSSSATITEANPTVAADPVDTSANASHGEATGDLWGNFVGTDQAEATPVPKQQQTVNIGGHTVNIPPKLPSSKGAQGKGGKGSQSHGNPNKGTWRPVLPEQQQPPAAPENRDLHVTDGSHAQSMFSSSSPYNQNVKGEGKNKDKEGKSRSKGKEGKTQSKGKEYSGKGSGYYDDWRSNRGWGSQKGGRYHDANVSYRATNIYGTREQAEYQLQRNFPEHYNDTLSEFPHSPEDDQWFVRCEWMLKSTS